jgi:hypothetical protein
MEVDCSRNSGGDSSAGARGAHDDHEEEGEEGTACEAVDAAELAYPVRVARVGAGMNPPARPPGWLKSGALACLE